MGYQVTMQPESPLMNLLLSDSTSHNVGHVQLQATVKWVVY